MEIPVKRRVRRLLESTTLGYRYLLRREGGAKGLPARPQALWHNAVLRTVAERDAAIEQVKRLGLPLVGDPPKNWDCLAAIDCIMANTNKRGRILDAGAETYSKLLPWLFLYGYRRLDAINITFQGQRKLGPITFRYGDVRSTDYADQGFDAIGCLSVVEHGVDLDLYFREMSRILKPGGVLVTSTDYWEVPIDTSGREMYGVPVHVFSRCEIIDAIKLAGQSGLVPTGPLDLGCEEKVVHWGDVDLDYTFLIFCLRKVA